MNTEPKENFKDIVEKGDLARAKRFVLQRRDILEATFYAIKKNQEKIVFIFLEEGFF